MTINSKIHNIRKKGISHKPEVSFFHSHIHSHTHLHKIHTCDLKPLLTCTCPSSTTYQVRRLFQVNLLQQILGTEHDCTFSLAKITHSFSYAGSKPCDRRAFKWASVQHAANNIIQVKSSLLLQPICRVQFGSGAAFSWVCQNKNVSFVSGT